MNKSFTEEQIIGILKEAEATGNTQEMCRQHNVTEQTFYQCRSKYGGMEVSEAKRLKELEKENSDLKKLVSKSWAGQFFTEMKFILGRRVLGNKTDCFHLTPPTRMFALLVFRCILSLDTSTLFPGLRSNKN